MPDHEQHFRPRDAGMMPFLATVVYALAHTRGSGQRSEHPEGDRVSDESEGIGASGDIISALSDRVSELTKRVGSLESELDAARKRVAVYEEFDATVRDALSGALQAAHQIRARAENAAQQILEQAREERKMLIKEIERLRGERDGLADEIASTRRSGFSALRGPRREAAPAVEEKTVEETTADSRALAAEALRGVFTELLEDIRKQAGTVADAAREANAAAEQARAAQQQAKAAQDEARSAQEEARRAVEAQRAAEAERSAAAARAAEQAQRATEDAARAAEEARKGAEAQRLAQQQATADRSLEAERTAEAARAAQEAMRAAQEAARAVEAERAAEAQRANEAARAAQEAMRAAQEAARAAGADRAADAERAAAEAERASAAARAAEDARRAADEARVADAARLEQQRREDEERRAARWREEEQRRATQWREEEERRDQQRREEEARRAEGARLAAEEVRRTASAEALRIVEAARVAGTAARAAQEAGRAAEAARAAQPPPVVEEEELFARPSEKPSETPPATPELTLVEREPVRSVAESEQLTPEREEGAAPTSNIVLMLSPVPSFARLVDIERRIQSLAQVRTLYVRDFGGGVSTLAVGLRVPMLVDELWSAIATLDHPRFALQRSGGTSLELRIEGEAGAGVA